MNGPPERPVADVPPEPLAAIVGAQLRRLRTRLDLSLDSLSKRARVSRGMLSQIELGRSAPTITVLSRIAAALDVPVSAFLARDAQGRAEILRREESKLLHTPDGGFVSRALFPFQGERRSEFYELQLQPGCRHDSEAHGSGTTENLVVSTGRLRVEIDGSAYEIEAGDALYFRADLPHAYVNPGTHPATAYLVMAYAESVSY